MNKLCTNINDVKTIYVLGEDCKFYDLQGNQYTGDLSLLEQCCDCQDIVIDPCEGIICENGQVCINGICVDENPETPCTNGVCLPTDCDNCLENQECVCQADNFCRCQDIIVDPCPPTGCTASDCDICPEGTACRCNGTTCECLPDCETVPCSSQDCSECPEGQVCQCQEDGTCQCQDVNSNIPDPCSDVDCSGETCPDGFTPICQGGACQCVPDCFINGCGDGEICTPSGCVPISGNDGTTCAKEIELTTCSEEPIATTPNEESCPILRIAVSCDSNVVRDEFGNVIRVDYFNCTRDLDAGCGEIESEDVASIPDHSLPGSNYTLTGTVVLFGGCTYVIDQNGIGSGAYFFTAGTTTNTNNEFVWTLNGNPISQWEDTDANFLDTGNNVVIGDELCVRVQSGNRNGTPCCSSNTECYDTCECLDITVDESTIDCESEPNTVMATVTNNMFVNSAVANIEVGGVMFNLSGGQSDTQRVNINPDGRVEFSAGEGVCEGLVEDFELIEGCTNQDSCNYNPDANCDDGTCKPTIEFDVAVDYPANDCIEVGEEATVTITVTQGTDVEYSFDNITFSSNNTTTINEAGTIDACVRYIDESCEVVKQMVTITSCTPQCPDGLESLEAPAVDVTEPTCANNVGTVNATTGCPDETTIQYSIDGGTTWNATPPTYANNLEILTRCNCNQDTSVSSQTTDYTTNSELTFGCTNGSACNTGSFDCSRASDCEFCSCQNFDDDCQTCNEANGNISNRPNGTRVNNCNSCQNGSPTPDATTNVPCDTDPCRVNQMVPQSVITGANCGACSFGQPKCSVSCGAGCDSNGNCTPPNLTCVGGGQVGDCDDCSGTQERDGSSCNCRLVCDSTVTISGPTEVCPGQTVTLTRSINPSAAGSGFWTRPDGSTSLATTLTVGPGTYMYTFNYNTQAGTPGCQTTDTHIVNLLDSTDPSCCNLNTNIQRTNGSTSNFELCPGDSETLVASTSNFSGVLSYEWSTGATTSSITVTQGGTYTVKVTDANGCEDEDSIMVTLLDANDPSCCNLSINSSGNTICPGQTGTITTSASNANGQVTYTISPGGQSNTSGTFTGLSAGMYTVSAVDSNGCMDDDGATINSLTSNSSQFCNQCSNVDVTISGPTEVCPNETVTLALNTSGSISNISWSNGSSASSITVGAGNYSVTVTDNNGCTADDTHSVSLLLASDSACGCTCSTSSTTSATTTQPMIVGGGLNGNTYTFTLSGSSGSPTLPGIATAVINAINAQQHDLCVIETFDDIGVINNRHVLDISTASINSQNNSGATFSSNYNPTSDPECLSAYDNIWNSNFSSSSSANIAQSARMTCYRFTCN